MSINKKLNEDFFKTKKTYKKNNDRGKLFISIVKRNLFMFTTTIVVLTIIMLFKYT